MSGGPKNIFRRGKKYLHLRSGLWLFRPLSDKYFSLLNSTQWLHNYSEGLGNCCLVGPAILKPIRLQHNDNLYVCICFWTDIIGLKVVWLQQYGVGFTGRDAHPSCTFYRREACMQCKCSSRSNFSTWKKCRTFNDGIELVACCSLQLYDLK